VSGHSIRTGRAKKRCFETASATTARPAAETRLFAGWTAPLELIAPSAATRTVNGAMFPPTRPNAYDAACPAPAVEAGARRPSATRTALAVRRNDRPGTGVPGRVRVAGRGLEHHDAPEVTGDRVAGLRHGARHESAHVRRDAR